jgi:hypothetical protein
MASKKKTVAAKPAKAAPVKKVKPFLVAKATPKKKPARGKPAGLEVGCHLMKDNIGGFYGVVVSQNLTGTDKANEIILRTPGSHADKRGVAKAMNTAFNVLKNVRKWNGTDFLITAKQLKDHTK